MKGLCVKKFSEVLLVWLFLTANAYAAAPKNVFFVLWDGCGDACRGFRDALQKQNVEVSLQIRDLKKDLTRIPEVIAEIKREKPDLLVTWGTLPTVSLVGTAKDALSPDYVAFVPTVFMVVSQPVESGLVPALSSQGRNITGVSHLPFVPEQLQAARQFRLFDRLGIVYNAADAGSASAVEQVKKYAALMNFDVIDRTLPFASDGKPDAAKIPALVAELAEQKVGLIYLPPDAVMNENRSLLTQSAIEAGIPVFSASEGAVRNGDALFAYVHRYYTVGLAAGKKAARILKNGVPAYDIPIDTPHRGVFVVNMTAARKLGIYPPASLVQGADLINVPSD